MYSNLYKSYWVNVCNDETRVIDNNGLVEKKLKGAVLRAASVLQADRQVVEFDDFSDGLSAESLDALLTSTDDGMVLKSVLTEEQESLQREIETAKEELAILKNQADRMIEDAKSQIGAMQIKAYEEAKNQGYEEGKRIGLEEAKAAKAECDRLKKHLQEEYQQKVQQLEPAFMETITGIYEHIFKVDLSDYQEFASNLLLNTMQEIDSARNCIVHVSKEDYQTVIEQKDRLRAQAGGSTLMEIVEDMTLPKAQCYIETENGIFDCSLDTQLRELGKKLRLLSYESSK